MPRPTPKQLREYPPTPVPPPPLRAFRVTRSFNYDGRTFHIGELYSLDSTLAQAIHAEHPEFMKIA